MACEAQDHCSASVQSESGRKIDRLLWVCGIGVVLAYLGHLFVGQALVGQAGHDVAWFHRFLHSVFEIVNTVWWGVVVGIFMIALIGRVPREFVMSVLGNQSSVGGIARATLAGVLLDLCSHGILMVATKLYERGASLGQVMAFLVASPWNSLSLTLILIALVGVGWTLAFIVLSMVVAFLTGLVFARFEQTAVLPANPNRIDLPEDFAFWKEARLALGRVEFSFSLLGQMLVEGIKGSRMVVRWILFGILLASVMRALLSPEMFAGYFGPTLLGLGVTVLFATVLEVCSEGSTPFAADILTRAGAPGNSFAFLMGGVATDYTEIMVLKDTTGSWKVALFLPLISLPQILLLAYLLNQV